MVQDIIFMKFLRIVVGLLTLPIVISGLKILEWNFTLFSAEDQLSPSAAILNTYFQQGTGTTSLYKIQSFGDHYKVQLADGQQSNYTKLLFLSIKYKDQFYFLNGKYKSAFLNTSELFLAIQEKIDRVEQNISEAKGYYSILYSNLTELELQSEEVKLTLKQIDIEIDQSFMFSWTAILLSFLLSSCVIFTIGKSLVKINPQSSRQVFFGFSGIILVLLKYKCIADPFLEMVVIYLIKTGPLITEIAAVKQSIFLIEDYIIIPIVICFFLQLYSHKKCLFKQDQFYSSSYWVVIALLLYSLDSFSVAVFTIYHITVSIPSEFKQKTLTSSQICRRTWLTIFIVLHLHLLKLMVDDRPPCLPYSFQQIFTNKVSPISSFTIFMLYLNGVIRIIFDLQIVKGIGKQILNLCIKLKYSSMKTICFRKKSMSQGSEDHLEVKKGKVTPAIHRYLIGIESNPSDL